MYAREGLFPITFHSNFTNKSRDLANPIRWVNVKHIADLTNAIAIGSFTHTLEVDRMTLLELQVKEALGRDFKPRLWTISGSCAVRMLDLKNISDSVTIEQSHVGHILPSWISVLYPNGVSHLIFHFCGTKFCGTSVTQSLPFGSVDPAQTPTTSIV
jgi:hypothetical protein